MSKNLTRPMRQKRHFISEDRFIWLPIPLLITAISGLWVADLPTVYESKYVLISLNFLFSTLASLLVAVLIGRSFLVNGELGLLMMGCGVLSWGLGLTVAAAFIDEINNAVTIHNTLTCLGAVCHVLGIVCSRKQYRVARQAGLILTVAYTITSCVIFLVVMLTIDGVMPPFFVQNQGGTFIRYVVLGSAAVMFGITGSVLFLWHRLLLSRFLLWYGTALLLMAIGVTGVMLESVTGGWVSWAGRIAQFMAGIYLVMAAITSSGESGLHVVSLTRAFHELQENYRTLVEMCPDAIAVHADGKIVFLNPAAVHLIGAESPADIIGREVLSLVHPEDRDVVEARMNSIFLGSSGMLSREHRIIRLDGRCRTVESAGARINFQGRMAMQVVLRDITRIRKIDAALRLSEQRFRLALRHAPVSVAAQDKNNRFIWAYNQRSINPADLIGKTDEDVLAPEDAARLKALKRQVMETEQEVREQGWATVNGKRMFIDLYIEPMRNADGKIDGVWLATVDLTPMKLAEEALRASEERYFSLFNGMSEGFVLYEIITDGRGLPCDYRFVDVNPSFVRLTGLKREDVIGKTLNQVIPRQNPKWLQLYRTVVLFGEAVHFDTYSSSLQRHFEIFAYRPLPDQLAIVFMDITERKQAEKRLMSSLAEKEMLIKEIHHRVKNNLQIISSLISLQIDSQTDEKSQLILSDVKNRVRTMALMHEKLYQTEDFTRLNFAEYAASILKYLWDAHGAVTGNMRLSTSLAPVSFPIDAALHCGLILNELANNAIKHAFPHGSGEIDVTLAYDSATRGVCLRVCDNGVGFPADFDWRQSGSLGLHLVQMLVGQMRGTVQTGPGPGAKFQINFTLKESST